MQTEHRLLVSSSSAGAGAVIGVDTEEGGNANGASGVIAAAAVGGEANGDCTSAVANTSPEPRPRPRPLPLL